MTSGAYEDGSLVSRFANAKLEPAGLTDDPDVRMSQSIMDYTLRRLALDYLDFDTRSALGIHSADERQRHPDTGSHQVPDNAGTTAAELVDSAPSVAPAETAKVEASSRVAEFASVIESPSVLGDSREAAASKPATATAQTSAELLEQNQDAPGLLLPRVRGLRKHQRLQLIAQQLWPGPDRSGRGPSALLTRQFCDQSAC